MNKIIFILLLIFLTSPAFALPETSEPVQPVQVEQSVEQVPIEESITTTPSAGEIEKNSAQEPYDKSDLKNQIVPETKGELFRVAFMFLKVMLAVGVCSTIIYFLLLFVRKNYSDILPQKPHDEDSQGNLKSPQSENEALKVFFNQTKNH